MFFIKDGAIVVAAKNSTTRTSNGLKNKVATKENMEDF